jgi:hypothetical protein
LNPCSYGFAMIESEMQPEPGSSTAQILFVFEVIFTIIFAIELAINLFGNVSLGFVCVRLCACVRGREGG